MIFDEQAGERPAFPQSASTGNLEDWRHGISMRDYFACAALAWITAGDPLKAAERTYLVADQMLIVRLQGQEARGQEARTAAEQRPSTTPHV